MSNQNADKSKIASLRKSLKAATSERDQLRRFYVNHIEMLCIGIGCDEVRRIVDRFEERNK